MKYFYSTCQCLLLTLCLSAQSQQATTPQLLAESAPPAPETLAAEEPAEEAAGEETEEATWEFSGSADVYYQVNTNGQAPGLTAFTPDHNSVSLGMAKVAAARSFGKVGMQVDLGFGPRADVANGFLGTSFAQIQQLFITYQPTEKVTLTAGNFGTHFCYEVVDPAANFHYSTSYMFTYGPFYHTGIKADMALSDRLSVMVGLFDDTDNKFDVLAGKHFGAQVGYATDAGDIYLNYLTGTDGVDTVSAHQVDLVAAFELNEKWSLGVNTTVKQINPDGDQLESSRLFGAALYLDYAVSETLALGLRTESFNDFNGVIFGVPDLSIFATTLSANVQIGELTFIPELRVDAASADIFTDITGDLPEATGVSPRFLLAAVYAF